MTNSPIHSESCFVRLTANEVTFSYSEPVDVTSIVVLEGNAFNINYAFSPTGETNSPITESLTGGITAASLNWCDGTAFTIEDNFSTNDYDLCKPTIYPIPVNEAVFIPLKGRVNKLVVSDVLGKNY